MILFLLFLKHYIVDFPLQTDRMVMNKGTYGDLYGIQHSTYHAIGTTLILVLFTTLPTAIILGLLDGLIHYHIDYIKMRYGTKDIKTKQFWNELGLDQLFHSLTYLLIVKLC
jgi:hypothetical protein